MIPSKLPGVVSYDELIAFMDTMAPGQEFLTTSGDVYKTLRELTGHGWSWACHSKNANKVYAVSVCDLICMKRLGT